jgi:hypothetical protein
VPSRSSAAPTSSLQQPSSTKEITPAFSFAVPMMVTARHVKKPLRCSVEKSVLIACDICHSDAIEIVDRGAEPDRVRYIAGFVFLQNHLAAVIDRSNPQDSVRVGAPEMRSGASAGASLGAAAVKPTGASAGALTAWLSLRK